MNRCLLNLGLAVAIAAAFLAGCSQSAGPEAQAEGPKPNSPPPEVRSLAPDLIAKLHWLGKKRLASENNATNFMAIWTMPESARLEAQTLDKLATAPWRLLKSATPLSNAPVALLRPLLDDLVQEESYLEVRAATNQPGQLVLAIRLDAARAARWQTNLAAVLESLAGNRVTRDHPPAFGIRYSSFDIQVSRAGDWSLVSISALSSSNSVPTLLGDFQSRLELGAGPFPARATNFWLEAEADVRKLNAAFTLGWQLPKEIPQLALTVIGEGGGVRTLASLVFPGPAPVELEPWNIPTNLVHDPVIGFMAVRGFRPLLRSLAKWDEAQGSPPNQAYFWGQAGTAPLRFFAVPSPDASSHLHRLSVFLLDAVNPLFAVNTKLNIRYGEFQRLPNSQSIRWRGLPLISPYLDLANVSNNSFVTGGTFQNLMTNRPVPAGLVEQIQSSTNLLFYDWEVSEPCVFGLIQPLQIGRFLLSRPLLTTTNNAGLPWLAAIAPKLGSAGTSIRLADTDLLLLSRTSALGLTGAELQLLVDWLESPNFPMGLFSTATRSVQNGVAVPFPPGNTP